MGAHTTGATGRVFHLMHSMALGGIEIHVLQLAQAEQRAGWRPTLLVRQRSWLMAQAQALGLDVMPLRMRGFFDPISILKLRYAVRRERPHILHAHGMRGTFYARTATQHSEGPALVQTAHSTNSWKHFDREAPIICVSKAVEEALRRRGLSNLHLIHNGIPVTAPEVPDDLHQDPLYALLAGLRRTGDRVLLLHVGRFIPDKAQEWLIARMAALPPELAREVRLVLVGDWQTSDYGHRCRASVAASADLAGRVTFAGLQSPQRMPAWYGLADILVVPSRREALGLTLIEGARAGLPGLASAIGGIPEVVIDGHTGYLFEPGDADGFMEGLLRLLDPQVRQTLGQKARARFLVGFTEQRMLEQTLALYDRSLPRNRSASRCRET